MIEFSVFIQNLMPNCNIYCPGYRKSATTNTKVSVCHDTIQCLHTQFHAYTNYSTKIWFEPRGNVLLCSLIIWEEGGGVHLKGTLVPGSSWCLRGNHHQSQVRGCLLIVCSKSGSWNFFVPAKLTNEFSWK